MAKSSGFLKILSDVEQDSSGDELQPGIDQAAGDKHFISRPWSGEPLHVVSGRGTVVEDVTGKSYLDFTSGYFVNQAGHCHPKIVSAAKSQLGKIHQVSGKNSTPSAVRLAKTLVETSPESVEKVFFTTGGSETNEFAFKAARQTTGKKDIAALKNAYHGLSLGVLPTCASQKYRDTAGLKLSENYFAIENAYCYRCPYKTNCQTQCLDQVEGMLSVRKDTAALVAEPMQAVGGIIPPKKWWERLNDLRLRFGLLLILDEIQTGLGRTGKMFGAEHYDLQPDMIATGKGISGGVGSLAALLLSRKVHDSFDSGTAPTNAGNAVSAAAGQALIEVIQEDGMIENAARMEGRLKSEIAELDDPWVGDVRFSGLLGGVELVLDKESLEPLPKAVVMSIQNAMQDRGILLSVSGPLKNFLRLQPPLSVSNDEVDEMVFALKESLLCIRETVS